MNKVSPICAAPFRRVVPRRTRNPPNGVRCARASCPGSFYLCVRVLRVFVFCVSFAWLGVLCVCEERRQRLRARSSELLGSISLRCRETFLPLWWGSLRRRSCQMRQKKVFLLFFLFLNRYVAATVCPVVEAMVARMSGERPIRLSVLMTRAKTSRF